MADRFTFAVSIPRSVSTIIEFKSTIIEFKSFRKLPESFHIFCLFVTPSWSGTNALKFFIDNKYIIYKTNHSKR